MTILIDLDDTIESLGTAWCHRLNEQYGTNVSYEDITEWDVAKFFPDLTRNKVYKPLHDEDFWDTVKLKEGAAEFIEKLFNEGHEIYIVTSSYYDSIKPKFEKIIRKNMPFLSWSNIIVCKNKYMISGDVLIDDGVHNLLRGNYKKILFTAPHNKSYDAGANGMDRVYSWNEAYELIHTLTDNI